jgi:hypothetical protein
MTAPTPRPDLSDLVLYLRRVSSGGYGRHKRGDIEEGEMLSWDRSEEMAWYAADALEESRPEAECHRADMAESEIATLVAQLGQARQMLADAPHDSSCDSLLASRHANFGFPCTCWKAGL